MHSYIFSDFDSNECLENILELCKLADSEDRRASRLQNLEDIAEYAAELSDKVEMLNEYLSKGGKLPKAWRGR